MSISATEPVGSMWTATTSGAAATTTTQDKDMFLQLMVTQMRYQDPLNPSDSSEFLAQTAQFTSLEKMQEVADATSSLLAAQNAFGASALVGREVAWLDESGTELSGPVQAVSFGASGPVLQVDGTEVPLGSVLTVRAGTVESDV